MFWTNFHSLTNSAQVRVFMYLSLIKHGTQCVNLYFMFYQFIVHLFTFLEI